MSGTNINSVFYAEAYHPIQAGSIDGTDVLPHDSAVYRALLCSSAGLYDPFGDPKVTGDPYCTIFVGRLSRQTEEETLRKAMSRYGRVKNLRLVRDIVTGASRGYAFIEYETEREMQRAYEDAHHSKIDESEIIVDYNRQKLMPGWIPRRLGGGLGGKKESGQLRFGGRERPFRAPLRPIPYEELKRLGIPPPPEGQYMSRFKIPSPPRRRKSHKSREYSPSRQENSSSRKRSADREESTQRRNRSTERDDSSHKHYVNSYSPRLRENSPSRKRKSEYGEEHHSRGRSSSSRKRKEYSPARKREESSSRKRRSKNREETPPRERTRAEVSHHENYMLNEYSHSRRENTPSRKKSEDVKELPSRWNSSSADRGDSYKHHRHHHKHSSQHKRSTSRDYRS